MRLYLAMAAAIGFIVIWVVAMLVLIALLIP